ncbi:MAG TPA: alpha/beta fold hydrolase [Myxococcota bacterium]|nr:alpha/beta fold hydrolase [Myxococcota bacterium]
MGSGREKRAAALAFGFAATLVLACATPIGVTHLSARDADRGLGQSILNGDRTTTLSREYLERLGLVDLYEKNPHEALSQLRNGLGGPDEVGRLFALSELWFESALKSGDHGEYLASAIYAWAFLFPKDPAQNPTPYDGHMRQALDLYNRGITEGLAAPDRDDETVLDLTPREIPLPFGTFVMTGPATEFRYGGYRLKHFVSMRDVEIRGMRNRYRRAGIGSALGAQVEAAPGAEGTKWIPPNAKVPVTALVRLADVRAGIAGAKVNGSLELYDADETPSVQIDGRPVPLESEPSATIAYRLDKAPVWDFEIAGFRRPDFTLPGAAKTKGLFFLNPYRPGRIPVVFVHGTASSPARWAEMANELLGDPRVASRFQLWFFIYNSGQPILVSAANLRESLQSAVHDMDPQGKDPALRNVVVVGHSQGGLLTKLLVVKSGDAFWKNASDVPFADVKMSDDTRALLKRAAFFEPLPFVTRVVFISTPHKGSYIAENWLGMLARRFVNFPAAVTNSVTELGTLRQQAALRGGWRVPTAVDNMDWSNPGLRTLYSLPIAPWVKVNSIIPVLSEPYATAKDGVVAYQSAHIEPVESELVVYPSGHSTQATPPTIEEVRRILYEHAGIH